MSDWTWDPTGDAREALRRIVADFGTPALSNPRVMEHGLDEQLPNGTEKQKSIIIGASKAGVSASLQEHVAQGTDPGHAVQLTASRLAEKAGFEAAACRWVTSEFAQALGHQLSNAATPASDLPTGVRGSAVIPGADLTERKVGTGLREGDLASAWQLLLPIKSWINNPGWHQGLRLLVIPYALLPVIFLAIYSNSTDPAAPGKAYTAYIAPLWALAFWFLIRPGNITKRVIQTAIGIVIWIFIWPSIVTVNIDRHLDPISSFPVAIGVGINEEISKALPIIIAALILLKLRKTKWDARMWMFLGTISGLTYGVLEALTYTKDAILDISQNPGDVNVGILEFAFRVFVDGFQHATWTGIAGFFIGMGINYPGRRVALISFGIAIPALLHGLNDWTSTLANPWPWICINAISLVLFLGYTIPAHSIDRSVRRSPTFHRE